MEDPMEKNMEDEMETVLKQGFIVRGDHHVVL